MKNNNKLSSSGSLPHAGNREKILIGFFAALSLTFGLFYAFVPNAAPVSASDGAAFKVTAQQPTAAVENSISANRSADAALSPASVADVVAKAQAFKATLTAAQIATLEKTYTTTLARRWSNLPCGSGCRNGIQFSTLTSTQLAAALAVIQAAAGTAANEGYDEFNQVRLADDYLGANGGGSGYSGGLYFIAFLNTPNTTGGWMLQYGGHHYAANIAYNNGRVVGATPQFEGVEPTTFTINGATYSPITQERNAMANMLASLSATQLATAKLSQTFSDITLAPGESNGGSNAFPATKVGIAVSTLSDAQKLLVLEAMKPWVQDLDDTVAANLLTIYQNELNGTYIAYAGSGTAGNAASFLIANTDYSRIDGTSGWFEFVCQSGVVIRNQVHYHSVYRDRVRDYGADLTLTTPLDTTTTAARRAQFDFDGDNKTDISVFRPTNGTFYVQQSSTSGFTGTQFGQSGDTLVPADYDGDNRTDVAVFRSGTWYLQRSTSGFLAQQFGLADDVPVPGDYDADGKADLAVFRQSNGTWYIQGTTSGFTAVQFGQSGDRPIAADYDNDGKTDVAVNRAGTWYIQRSSAGFYAVAFGLATDRLVPADYDGNGSADVAVFRPSNGTWYVLNSQGTGATATQFGASTDTPAPGDYDGDGKADFAVFRSGTWYIQRTTSGFTGVAFGASTDTPVPSVDVR